MLITSLEISNNYKTLFFSQFYKKTLIWSEENSCGKTTLIRFILYALGFDVPPTKQIKLKNYNTVIKLENPKKIVLRKGEIIKINCPDNDICKEFDLSYQQAEAHSFLFDINNLKIINNLLGTFYIDQDKGWTLLNRGKVISSKISFNIEDFIIGLALIDTTSYDIRINKLDEEIKRYTAILDVVALEEETQGGYKEEEQINKLKCRKSNLSSSINELKKQKFELNTILQNNKNLMETIESYNLMIRVDNMEEPVRVTKQNIIDYGINQFILKSQINEIDVSIAKLEEQIGLIDSDLDGYSGLVNVSDVSNQVINQVKSINLNQAQLKDLIESLKKEKRDIDKVKRELIENDYKIVNKLSLYIKNFAQKLNVYDGYVSKEKDYLKTRNLKEYSGVLYHKVTLCYRLSYYCAIKDVLGLELPFIIDSPGAAEVKASSLAEMMDLVNQVVKEQIIISSIYDNELNINDAEKIILRNGIFGDKEK